MSDSLQTHARPCAGLLAAGIGLLLLGPWPAVAGYLQYVSSASMYGSRDGVPLVWVGCLLSLAGTAALSIGVYRLGQHVDRLGGVRYRPDGKVDAPPL